MEAKELMLGDYIYDLYGNKAIVRKLEDYNEHVKASGACIELVEDPEEGKTFCLYGQIEPIPLTPEILEKNYGKETQVGISDKPCWGEIGAIWSTMLWKCENSFWLEVSAITGGFVKKHIRYVNELQHALRLAGIKKEIVL